MDHRVRVLLPAHFSPQKLHSMEVFVNIAPEYKEQAHTATHQSGCVAREAVERAIASRFGIAGSIIAAAIGYLIEWRATGGATGFAGAMICPLIFIAVYQQLAQPAN